MLNAPPPLELSTTLSLRSGEQSWGTERRMALLAAIDTEGSISAAARKVGLSYKAAWDAVDMMNNLAGDLLVERVTGGKRGGGAHLTARARELVAWYQAAQAEHQRFMDLLARFGPDGTQHLDLLHSMALQTSARNRLGGTVERIEAGRLNDHVHLRVDEGLVLVATVTHASTERLALASGRHALAFLKAQAVQIRPLGASQARGASVTSMASPTGATSWIEAASREEVTNLAGTASTTRSTNESGSASGGHKPTQPAHMAERTGPTRLTASAESAESTKSTESTESTEHSPAVNCWTGRISHREQDAGLTEITLDITPRIRVTGFADPLMADLAGMAPGDTAQAFFQAADVLIGTLD